METRDEIESAPRFMLIGHSLGGAVAVALAELMPSAVSSLMLLARAGQGVADGPPTRALEPIRRDGRLSHDRHQGHQARAPRRRASDQPGGQLVVRVREATRAIVSAGATSTRLAIVADASCASPTSPQPSDQFQRVGASFST